MSSWQVKFLNAGVRLLIRRRKWGKDEHAVARRARRLFRAVPIYQRLRTRGLQLTPVRRPGVRGEWGRAKRIRQACRLVFARWRLRVLLVCDTSPDYRGPCPSSPGRVCLVLTIASLQNIVSRQRLTMRWQPINGCSRKDGLRVDFRRRRFGRRWPDVKSALARERDGASASGMRRLFLSLDRPCRHGRISPSERRTLRDVSHREHCRVCRRDYLGGRSPFETYASPAHADLSGLPPILLQVGSTELLLDDTRVVHDRIQKANGVSRLEIYDDVFHCWQMLDGVVPEARVALTRAAESVFAHVSRRR